METIRGRSVPRRRSAVAERASERVSLPLIWVGCGGVLLLALTLGGGTRQGLWPDAVVQLASLALLGAALLQLSNTNASVEGRAALRLLAAIALLPLVQLIPLPPGTWIALPGRSDFAAAYAEGGMAVPWLGISLSPPATWRSALSLLPAAAVFISVVLLGHKARRVLTLGLIAFGLVSVLLGLAQLAQGPDSGLRFHAVTNPTEAVGFFANRNHFAALLYVVLPFTAAWSVGLASDRRPQMLVGVSLCLLVFSSLLLGLGMARSRSGLMQAMLAGLASVLLAWRARGSPVTMRGYRFVLVGGLAGAFLMLQFASLGILQRLDVGIAEDLRWEFARVTAGLAHEFQPPGSGLGTFEPIYRMHEGIERLRPAYVNHAHNDYVELVLEGGWPAVILMAGCFVWLAFASLRVWRSPRPDHAGAVDLALPRAAMIAAVLLCLHSAVDYPLRTTALSTLFALCCALMVRPFRIRSLGAVGRRQEERVAPSGARGKGRRPQRAAAGLPPSNLCRGADELGVVTTKIY